MHEGQGAADVRAARRCLLTAAQLAGRRPPTGAVRLHRGVYLLPDAAAPAAGRADFLVRCLAALLAAGPGACLSHRFAGALHGITDPPGPTIAATVRLPSGRRMRPRPDLETHRTTGDLQVAEIGGLRCTTLERTLIDLAATERLAVVVLALSRAEGLRVGDVEALGRELRRRAGTPGIPALREALEIVARCGSVVRSLLEAELLVLCLRGRLPLPAANARVRTGVGWFEVDALWPRRRVVVETDGFASHGPTGGPDDRRRFAADRARWSAIEAAGHRVLVYAWHHVVHEPALVRAQIAQTLALATA